MSTEPANPSPAPTENGPGPPPALVELTTRQRFWPLRMYDAWQRFWFAPQPPQSLCVFRVLLGIFFLVFWLLRAPHVLNYFSDQSIQAPIFLPPAGGWSGAHGIGDYIGLITQPVGPITAWCLYICIIAALILFTIGLFTFWAGLTYLLLYLYYYFLELHLLGASYDRLFLHVTTLMVMAWCDEAVSVSAWLRRRRGKPPAERIPYWPARLICIQVMAVYLGTGMNKIYSDAWSSGEVLYYAMIGGWGSELSYWMVRNGPGMWFYDVFVMVTIFFEVYSPFGLYVRRFQPYFFTIGFFFHLGIALTLQIWQFLAMPASYVLFVDPDKFAQWYARRIEKLPPSLQALLA